MLEVLGTIVEDGLRMCLVRYFGQTYYVNSLEEFEESIKDDWLFGKYNTVG